MEQATFARRRKLAGFACVSLFTLAIWTVTLPAFEELSDIRPTFHPITAYALWMTLFSPAIASLCLLISLPILLPARLVVRFALLLAMVFCLFIPGSALTVFLQGRFYGWIQFLLTCYSYYYITACIAAPVIVGVMTMEIVTQIVSRRRLYWASESTSNTNTFSLGAMMELTFIVAFALGASRTWYDPVNATMGLELIMAILAVPSLFAGWIVIEWLHLVLGCKRPLARTRGILLFLASTFLSAAMMSISLIGEIGTSRLWIILLSSLAAGTVAGSAFSGTVLLGAFCLRRCGLRLAVANEPRG